MKKTSIASPGRAREILAAVLGAQPDTDTGMAELLRWELSSRSGCPAHTLVRRALQLAAPAIAIDMERLTKICDAIVKEGDFVRAPGGLVVAGPIRLVALGDGRYRVFAGLPTIRLKTLVPGDWSSDGIYRTCCVSPDAKGAISESVGMTEGVVLTPSQWAGLDRSSKADERWLRSLSSRLAREAEPPGSLERDGPLPWQGLVSVPEEGFLWKHSQSGIDCRLWRARHPWLRWVSVWTDGRCPDQSRFVKLSSDEAARTAFAVANQNNAPIKISFRTKEKIERLSIKEWLPMAEYRYLSVNALRSTSDGGVQSWEIPLPQAESVRNTLHDRLGIIAVEEDAE